MWRCRGYLSVPLVGLWSSQTLFLTYPGVIFYANVLGGLADAVYITASGKGDALGCAFSRRRRPKSPSEEEAGEEMDWSMQKKADTKGCGKT